MAITNNASKYFSFSDSSNLTVFYSYDTNFANSSTIYDNLLTWFNRFFANINPDKAQDIISGINGMRYEAFLLGYDLSNINNIFTTIETATNTTDQRNFVDNYKDLVRYMCYLITYDYYVNNNSKVAKHYYDMSQFVSVASESRKISKGRLYNLLNTDNFKQATINYCNSNSNKISYSSESNSTNIVVTLKSISSDSDLLETIENVILQGIIFPKIKELFIDAITDKLNSGTFAKNIITDGNVEKARKTFEKVLYNGENSNCSDYSLTYNSNSESSELIENLYNFYKKTISETNITDYKNTICRPDSNGRLSDALSNIFKVSNLSNIFSDSSGTVGDKIKYVAAFVAYYMLFEYSDNGEQLINDDEIEESDLFWTETKNGIEKWYTYDLSGIQRSMNTISSPSDIKYLRIKKDGKIFNFLKNFSNEIGQISSNSFETTTYYNSDTETQDGLCDLFARGVALRVAAVGGSSSSIQWSSVENDKTTDNQHYKVEDATLVDKGGRIIPLFPYVQGSPSYSKSAAKDALVNALFSLFFQNGFIYNTTTIASTSVSIQINASSNPITSVYNAIMRNIIINAATALDKDFDIKKSKYLDANSLPAFTYSYSVAEGNNDVSTFFEKLIYAGVEEFKTTAEKVMTNSKNKSTTKQQIINFQETETLEIAEKLIGSDGAGTIGSFDLGSKNDYKKFVDDGSNVLSIQTSFLTTFKKFTSSVNYGKPYCTIIFNSEIQNSKNDKTKAVTDKENYNIDLPYYLQEGITFKNKEPSEIFSNISGNVVSKFLISSLFTFKKYSTSERESYYNTQTQSIIDTVEWKMSDKLSVENESYNQISFGSENVLVSCKAQNSADKKINQKNLETAFKNLVTIVKNELKKVANELKVEETSEENETEVTTLLDSTKKFTDYISSRFTNSGHERDFFYINENANADIKRLPMTPFVDIEFRVPSYDFENKEFTDVWIPVTSVAKNETMNSIGVNDDSSIVVDNQDGTISKIIVDSNVSTNIEGFSLGVEGGSYFDSFELVDSGQGAKEIALKLKSPDDYNLEKIILNSINIDSIKSLSKSKETEVSTQNSDVVKNILKSTSANFRIRFGYRDEVPDVYADNIIRESSNFSENFINRTKRTGKKDNADDKIIKPVLMYPWTYFKITGVQTGIIADQNTYDITGVNSGTYALKSMSIAGVSLDFSGDTITNDDKKMVGYPKNVLGTIAGCLINASKVSEDKNEQATPRICILGSDKGKVLSGFSRDSSGSDDTSSNTIYKEDNEYSYELENLKEVYLEPSDLDIENFFFAGTSPEEARVFTLRSNDSSSFVSIKTLLDKLVEWLPKRYYYISNSDSKIYAARMSYEQIVGASGDERNRLLYVEPHKFESIKYQVIEANASISGGKCNKTYFIRFYFEGPKIEANTDGEEYLRVYNYKNFQESLISESSINLNNGGLTLGNIVSAATVVTTNSTGSSIVFSYNNEKNTIGETGINRKSAGEKTLNSSTDENDVSSWVNSEGVIDTNQAFLTMNNVVFSNTNATEGVNIASALQQAASVFFSAMSNQAYTGSLTIIGDPFYYFDSAIEPAKYEIYLNMNRVEDLRSAKNAKSAFSGIYAITKITHSVDSSGVFSTTLEIMKRTF